MYIFGAKFEKHSPIFPDLLLIKMYITQENPRLDS